MALDRETRELIKKEVSGEYYPAFLSLKKAITKVLDGVKVEDLKKISVPSEPSQKPIMNPKDNSAYHIYQDGHQLTDEPVSITMVQNKYGGVKHLESQGYRLKEAAKKSEEKSEDSQELRKDVPFKRKKSLKWFTKKPARTIQKDVIDATDKFKAKQDKVAKPADQKPVDPASEQKPLNPVADQKPVEAQKIPKPKLSRVSNMRKLGRAMDKINKTEKGKENKEFSEDVKEEETKAVSSVIKAEIKEDFKPKFNKIPANKIMKPEDK